MDFKNWHRPRIIGTAGLVLFMLIPLIKTSNYQLTIANNILLWALFAMAFNMLFGVTGMLSFGQALYFGAGAYSVGLFVSKMGAVWFVPALVIGFAGGGLLALIIGPLVLRLTGVYFTMLTLAFAQLGWGVVVKWYDFTNGDDGIQGIIPPGFLGNKIVYYYFCLALAAASIWFLWRLSSSPFGLMLRCIRQNPNRVKFLGIRVKRNQLRIYVISGAFAALAGGLMAGVDSSVHPGMFYWTTSGEVILMSILGGMGQFYGPLVGAVLMILIEDMVGARTESWSLVIGLVMLVMVLALPKGIVGEIARLSGRWSKRRTVKMEVELGTNTHG